MLIGVEYDHLKLEVYVSDQANQDGWMHVTIRAMGIQQELVQRTFATTLRLLTDGRKILWREHPIFEVSQDFESALARHHAIARFSFKSEPPTSVAVSKSESEGFPAYLGLGAVP